MQCQGEEIIHRAVMRGTIVRIGWTTTHREIVYKIVIQLRKLWKRSIWDRRLWSKRSARLLHIISGIQVRYRTLILLQVQMQIKYSVLIKTRLSIEWIRGQIFDRRREWGQTIVIWICRPISPFLRLNLDYPTTEQVMMIMRKISGTKMPRMMA